MIDLSVLKKPLVSEKSSLNMEKGVYTFLVSPTATKVSVRKAFEQLFGEKVETVRIVSIVKKTRMAAKGKEMTRRQKGKKAMVTLVGDKKVDVFQTKQAKK